MRGSFFLSLFLMAVLAFALPANAELKSISSVQEISLGRPTLTDDKPLEFEIDVPKNKFSLFVQVIGKPELHYFLEEVISPEGEVVLGKVRKDVNIELADLDMDQIFRFRLSQNPSPGPVTAGSTAILIPNRNEVKLATGKWKFKVGASEKKFESHKVEIKAFLKSLAQPIDDAVIGVVDLNLYFSGAGRLNKSNYEKDKHFHIFYTQLKSSLGSVKIVPRLNSVEDVNIPNEFLTYNPADLSPDSLNSGDRATSRGINIYVSSIRSLDGISWGLPAAQSNEYFQNAILVSVPRENRMAGDFPENLERAFRKTGYVAAHEIGHLLGLFHVCEDFDRRLDDGLSDTECVPDTNAMINGASAGPFSQQQRMVMLRNPYVELYVNKE